MIEKQTKQAIVWRNDLKCRVGKKMGQACHAVASEFGELIRNNCDAEGHVSFKLTPDQMHWWFNYQRKIVMQVNSEAELMVIYQKAVDLGLPVQIVTDIALTEWEGPTKTCLAIGPAEDSEIDAVTGENGPLGRLKLM